jgi:hypothetical protein
MESQLERHGKIGGVVVGDSAGELEGGERVVEITKAAVHWGEHQLGHEIERRLLNYVSCLSLLISSLLRCSALLVQR